MIKKVFSDLVYILGEYPIYILMGMGLIYSIIELVETRPFMKIFSANSFCVISSSLINSLNLVPILDLLAIWILFLDISIQLVYLY